MIQAIFVHLGPAKASWVFSNIERHLNIFPNIPLVFISDNLPHLKKAEKLGCGFFQYRPSDEIEHVFQMSSHDPNFRHNFWRTSIERLMAVEQYQISSSQEKILHIESDVMLMPNFPWAKLERLDKLSWFSANHFMDCAALLYSPTSEKTSWLVKELKSNMRFDSHATDMTLLHAIRKANLGVVNLFPSTTKSIANETILNDRVRYLENISLASYFGGIFDVLDMGMWLTGQNPRNQGGKIIRYENFFTCDNEFTEKSFSLEGQVLSVGATEPEVLYNLHIHSKNRLLLSKHWMKELTKIVKDSAKLSSKKKFSISGYLGSQYDIYLSVNRNILIYAAIFTKSDRFLSILRVLFARLGKRLFKH